MRFRQGVQAEILLSLALVMLTGTALLAVIFLEVGQARIEGLHAMLGRGFVAEIQSPGFRLRGPDTGSWWRVRPDGLVVGLNASEGDLDAATLALADETARRGVPHVQSGAPWSPIRFASPDPESEGVILGRIEGPLSGLFLVGLVLADVLVFGLFGVWLMRRRVVGPLGRLSRAVQELGEGDAPTTVPTEGAHEIAELGRAFNEMQSALASRRCALEKAVSDLRGANAHLVQAREGLDRAERLAMVGSLAAGVAHEVGNPMGAMLAFLEAASRDPGLGDEGRRCLDRAGEQGERVRVILRQLLDFSRVPQVERAPISLAGVAEQVVELVAAQRRYEGIEMEVVDEAPAATAWGDAALASQILLNLVLNAADAMEGQPDRRLRLEIRPHRWRRRSGDSDPDPGDRERLDALACVVEDSGPGIDPGACERIFDPFFTTKAPGEGTGLGLANARRLAEEMGGRVELDLAGSSLGGARFCLVLPTEAMVAQQDSSEVRSERRAASGSGA